MNSVKRIAVVQGASTAVVQDLLRRRLRGRAAAATCEASETAGALR